MAETTEERTHSTEEGPNFSESPKESANSEQEGRTSDGSDSDFQIRFVEWWIESTQKRLDSDSGTQNSIGKLQEMVYSLVLYGVFSALIVALGLVANLLIPVPFLQDTLRSAIMAEMSLSWSIFLADRIGLWGSN